MKIVASCLGWNADEHEGAAALLKRDGAAGIEMVPTAIWGGWDAAFAEDAELPSPFAGLETPSMQSLLFGLPDLKLFHGSEAEDRLVGHLERLFRLARKFGVRALIFGSPRNRSREAMPLNEAMSRFGAFADRVGPLAAAAGTLLCLEANPTLYGCDFVTDTPALVDLFERIRQPGIGLHFDTGAAAINGEDLAALIQQVGPSLDHIHASEPNLATFAQPSDHHQAIAQALRDIDYRHFVSIEMVRGPNGLADLDEALAFVTGCYG